MGEHGERDVPVQTGVLVHLVVVQARFAFGGLEGLLDGSAGSGDPGQLDHSDVLGRKTDKVRQIGGVFAQRRASSQCSPDSAGPLMRILAQA